MRFRNAISLIRDFFPSLFLNRRFEGVSLDWTSDDDYWTGDDDFEAKKQGWSLFETDGALRLQKVDEANVFETDFLAWIYVNNQRLDGDRLAMKAFDILARDSTEEFLLIRNSLGDRVYKLTSDQAA